MKDAQDNMGWTTNIVKTLACVGLDSAGIVEKRGKRKGRNEIKLNINTSPLNGRCKINKKTGRK